MNKVLIKEFPNHVKDYGFLSDLSGETSYGIIKQELNKYSEILTEFIPNVPEEFYETHSLKIPLGTLQVWGVPKVKPHTLLSQTAIRLCMNNSGLIIGSFVKYLLGESNEYSDVDIVIPLSQWINASLQIPKGATANSFGGFKFVENNITYDVWCGDIQEYLNKGHIGYSLVYNKVLFTKDLYEN